MFCADKTDIDLAPLITERSVGGSVEDGVMSEVKPGDKELKLEVMTHVRELMRNIIVKKFKMPKSKCLIQFTLFGPYFTFCLLVGEEKGRIHFEKCLGGKIHRTC